MEASLKISGEENDIEVSPKVLTGPKAELHIKGNKNVVRIENGVYWNFIFRIFADNCRVLISEKCILQGGLLTIHANGSLFSIGPKTSVGNAVFQMHENSSIEIGEDCMFSIDVFGSVSDMHSIIDCTSNCRINLPAPIRIGNHVWIGKGCSLLKGTTIGDNSIIGANSTVSGNIENNVIAAGTPAKTIRTQVTWDRKLL